MSRGARLSILTSSKFGPRSRQRSPATL